ncbi:hypothetical protein [Derxia gummosa]|uniref:Uncharacterized protein n=1 Tax=Derxia gummosa DSM 723 TaxID=1121388 RepID=A0A8B6X798_9BURK|nr:hypothetical protein [Derxia gummosa]
MFLDHNVLGPRSFASVLNEAGVSINDADNAAWCLAIPGRDEAKRYSYVSPKSGKTIFALEYTTCIPAKPGMHEVWQFDHDFSEQEAIEVLGNRSYHNRKMG